MLEFVLTFTNRPHKLVRSIYSKTLVNGTVTEWKWTVTFCTARMGLGGLRPRPVPSLLYQM